MSRSCGKHPVTYRHTERGGSRVKFLIAVAIIAVVGYIAFQYIPVAIKSYQLKDLMQKTVNNAAMQGLNVDLLKKQLQANATDYGAPPDPSQTQVEVTSKEGFYHARIHYKQPIPLLVYTYEYEFDHSVKSIDLINFK